MGAGCAGGEGSESGGDSEMEGEEGWCRREASESRAQDWAVESSVWGPAGSGRRCPKHRDGGDVGAGVLRTLNSRETRGRHGDREAEDETWDTTPHVPRAERRTTKPGGNRLGEESQESNSGVKGRKGP